MARGRRGGIKRKLHDCELKTKGHEMATATKTKLQNFIDGDFVAPAEGATEEVVNPATGEAIAEAPLSTK
jgi:hypothetical protein